MGQVQFYVKKDDEATWESFKKICYDNRWKHSDFLMEKVREVVSLHKGGGSQTYLEFSTNPKTLPLHKTCVKGSKVLYRSMFYCKQIGDYRLPVACTRCKVYVEDSQARRKKHD